MSRPTNRVAIGETLAVLFCPSPNGKVFGVTIDKTDLVRVQAAGLWRVRFSHGSPYAYRSDGNHGLQLLHRFILSPPAGIAVDHVNHRTLDNRRSELREADSFQNSRNARPWRKKLYSSLKGVTLDKRNGLYISQITVNGKHKYLGSFSTPEAAGKAYDEAAKAYFGEFACINGDCK